VQQLERPLALRDPPVLQIDVVAVGALPFAFRLVEDDPPLLERAQAVLPAQDVFAAALDLRSRAAKLGDLERVGVAALRAAV